MIKLKSKLNIILMLYHMSFPTADTQTVNLNITVCIPQV